MLTQLVRHVAPGLVTRLSRGWNQLAAPQLGAGTGIMGGDKAGIGPTSRITKCRLTTATRNYSTIGNNRPRTMGAGIDLVVGNLGFPYDFAGLSIQCEHKAFSARVDD